MANMVRGKLGGTKGELAVYPPSERRTTRTGRFRAVGTTQHCRQGQTQDAFSQGYAHRSTASRLAPQLRHQPSTNRWDCTSSIRSADSASCPAYVTIARARARL